MLSTRIKKQEDDIKSLNVVLELKKEEILKLRQEEQELTRLREKVPRLHERCDKHRAKAEDLEAQLRQRDLVHRSVLRPPSAAVPGGGGVLWPRPVLWGPGPGGGDGLSHRPRGSLGGGPGGRRGNG